MRDNQIQLSILKFIDIIDCKITKEVNEHGRAMIVGHIQSDEEAKLLKEQESFASISFLDESKESHVLFTGVIESIAIETESKVKKATITLTGATRLLDLMERTRSFQNGATTYEKVIKTVGKGYPGMQFIMGSSGRTPIKDFVVQYKETDWEFIKRIASHSGDWIIPHYKSEGIKFSVGSFQSGKSTKMESVSYSITNNLGEYFSKKKNGVTKITREDAYYYSFDSREFYDLGDGITFQNKKLYVYGVVSELKGSELVHHYRLKAEGGFKREKKYNIKLIGASLDATILSVSRDKVKVHIKADGSQDVGTAKWFPYSTVYSSPDGSGWYCMPEVNDKVRLYFPNEKEEDAYVISSIHLEGGTATEGGEAPRSNPDNKSIMNKYNKKIELTPTSILLTNHDGMTIKLDDEEGISIISKKDILIQSEENLDICSVNESMTMEAAESIELIQGDTKITLKDDIVVEGAMVKVQ